MNHKELRRQVAVFDHWVKKYIDKKAFVFCENPCPATKCVAVARRYYGEIVLLSRLMNLHDMDMYLSGIIEVKNMQRRCKAMHMHRGYTNVLDFWGYSMEGMKKGCLTDFSF